jgi:hypothetical protein
MLSSVSAAPEVEVQAFTTLALIRIAIQENLLDRKCICYKVGRNIEGGVCEVESVNADALLLSNINIPCRRHRIALENAGQDIGGGLTAHHTHHNDGHFP